MNKEMIDFRSVRVGNMLAYCTHPVTIQTIGKNTFGFTDNKNEFQREINNTNFTGIPLSPAILEKCGFKMSLNKTCYGIITETGKSRLSVFTNGRFKVGTEDIEAEVFYLHQLQNLYYALTGQELQITL